MIVAPLSSGSAGNAYWFESDGTAILVDAGLGTRETKKRLESVGRNIETLSAIVLTHEHSDHTCTERSGSRASTRSRST